MRDRVTPGGTPSDPASPASPPAPRALWARVSGSELHADHLVGMRGQLAGELAAIYGDARTGLGCNGVLVAQRIGDLEVGMRGHLMVDHAGRTAEAEEVHRQLQRF